MLRYIYIFCAAFTIFFVVGGLSEFSARRGVSDREFLLATAASRFRSGPADLPWQLSYQCGTQVLYQFSLNKSAIERVAYRQRESHHVELSLTHEEIALLASGWGISEGAAYLRLSLGLSWRDKIAALLGGLSGYAVGRFVFSRTEPSCDGPEMVKLLDGAAGSELGRFIIKGNLEKFLILKDQNTVVFLGSQLSTIRKAFDSFAQQYPNDARLEDCAESVLDQPTLTCGDFVAIERVQTKLATPTAGLTRSDYHDSIVKPAKIALWMDQHSTEMSVAFRPNVFRGVTTKAALLRLGDSTLNEQGKELREETVGALISSLRFLAIGIGSILLVLIVGMGLFVLLRIGRHISDSLGMRFGRNLAADGVLFGSPPPESETITPAKIEDQD